MKYYLQQFNIVSQKIVFDVAWGEPLPDDNTYAVCKKGNVWAIIDIDSGLELLHKKGSKKALLELYHEKINQRDFRVAIINARGSERYFQKVCNMRNHQILKVGDRCTYIDVKDSVILTLIQYLPKSDTWIVEDEWHQFEVSPDRIIKVSEVD